MHNAVSCVVVENMIMRRIDAFVLETERERLIYVEVMESAHVTS